MAHVRIEQKRAKNGRLGRVAYRGGKPFAWLFWTRNVPDNKHYVIYVPAWDFLVTFSTMEIADFYLAPIAGGIRQPRTDHEESEPVDKLRDPEFMSFQRDIRQAFNRAIGFERPENF